jgi:hypothetical protein
MMLYDRYRRIMIQSRAVSLAASTFMLLAALYELYGTLLGSWRVDGEVADGILKFWIPLQAVVPIAFGCRILLLWKIEKVPYAFVSVSYLVCAGLSWFYFTNMFPDTDKVVYSLFDQGLASWIIPFFLFSFFRFLFTFLAALPGTASNEIDSYS